MPPVQADHVRFLVGDLESELLDVENSCRRGSRIASGYPTIHPECAGGFYVHRGFCDPLAAETQGLVIQGLIHCTKLAF